MDRSSGLIGGGITPFSKKPYVTLSRHTAPSRNQGLTFSLTNGPQTYLKRTQSFREILPCFPITVYMARRRKTPFPQPHRLPRKFPSGLCQPTQNLILEKMGIIVLIKDQSFGWLSQSADRERFVGCPVPLSGSRMTHRFYCLKAPLAENGECRESPYTWP